VVAVIALVGTAVAGIGGTGDGPDAEASAKKKRGPRGPAGPAGSPRQPGPPGPPGSSASFANAAGFAADVNPQDIDDAFEPLVTASIETSAPSIVIGTGTVTVGANTGGVVLDCRIEIDGEQEGVPVNQTVTSSTGLETVAVSAGEDSVPSGVHDVSIACRGSVADAAFFQGGNVTTTATG
jgi:hypothetical protein